MTNGIPEISIEEINDAIPGFLVSTLSDFSTALLGRIKNPHRTTFYQLFLITEGSGNFRLDENKIFIQSKTLCVVSKGMIWAIEQKELKGYVLFFDEEFLCEQTEDYMWLNTLRLFNNVGNIESIDLDKSTYIDMLVLINKIKMEYDSETEFAKTEILVNLLKTFLLTAERAARSKNNGDVINVGDIGCLVQFKKELEDNFGISRQVKFYAGLLCVTPKKLNQVTINYWGKSAKQVIEERVLLEIKRLLTYTNQSVKEIGTALGFSDPTNFNKYFRRYFKNTPAEYRASKKRNLYR